MINETEHELKLHTQFYNRVASDQKTFEIRKNDRDFQVGDILLLREWQEGEGYVENSVILIRRVVYISTFNQQPGYVVLGIARDCRKKEDK